ncbi:hypothetical protein D3C75_1297490 [compost metagenome]
MNAIHELRDVLIFIVQFFRALAPVPLTDSDMIVTHLFFNGMMVLMERDLI